MAQPARIEEFVAAYRDRNLELAPRMQGYSIPDFFARKRVEEELRRHRDELEQRVRQRTVELESSHRQLRQAQKLEALGRLAGGIAHDFNNTVAIILARTELVRRRVAGDEFLAGEMRRIEEAAGRAAALTAQLLAFARGQVVERRTIDLGATVTALGRTLVPLIGEHIELDVAAPDTPVAIDADQGQIDQVIMNLVVNARDAMPDGGRLRIEARAETVTAPRPLSSGALPPGDYAVLSVSDSGTGMDEDVQSRIFDPFFTTKTDGRGSGLGLSIVYGIVQQSGGGIAVTSAPGQGTRFDIYLPRASGLPAVTDGAAPAAAPSGAGTILLVEDEPDLRSALRQLLTEEGYRVLDASGPLEALALLRAETGSIDLVLTDLVMPRMHGRELARQARELRPGVEVLFMSGWDPDAASGPVPGSPFLRKPFTPGELLDRVRGLMPVS
jgi:signal transduction histidine kinase/CheY-like chemotaxis protein